MLTALQDTGNTLRDPITGRQVLVVGADVAQKLTGLTVQQLKKPVENVGLLPGLRLIPYRAVGQEAGLLLALKLPQVKIGTWQGNSLVAFAPEGLSPDGAYQALTGGVL
jgi:stage II sporulation protein GA (sporulation sigma-E factor processing peptidase)